MKEQETIEVLAEEARREEQLSELEQSLAEYSAGTLSPGRLAALKERAEREPELRLVLSAYRPLSSEQKGRISSALKAQVIGARRHAGASAEVSLSERDGPSDKSTHRARWPEWLLGIGIPVLAAASLAVFVAGGPRGALEPLGSYALEVRGTRALQRAAPEPSSFQALKSVVFPAGQAPVFWLRPERRVTGALAAFVFVSEGAGALRLLPHELERAESGAVRVTLGGVGGLPREGRLWLLLARPELASDANALLGLAGGEADTGSGWQRWKIDFTTDGNRASDTPSAP